MMDSSVLVTTVSFPPAPLQFLIGGPLLHSLARISTAHEGKCVARNSMPPDGSRVVSMRIRKVEKIPLAPPKDRDTDLA